MKNDYSNFLEQPKYFCKSFIPGEFISVVILAAAIARTVESYLLNHDEKTIGTVIKS